MLESYLGLKWALIEGLRILRNGVGKIHIVSNPGNHGRIVKKPRAKKRAQLNLDWMLWEDIRQTLNELGEEDITVEVSPRVDHLVEVAGWKYYATHGDQARGGTGLQGPIAPIKRFDTKRRKWAEQTGQRFDYLVMGHWHTFVPNLQGIIVNGSVKGFSEYDMTTIHEYEPAQQGWWLTHPPVGRPVTRPGSCSTTSRTGHEN